MSTCTEEKLCTKCHKNPRAGYQRWCAECRAAYNKKYMSTHKEQLRDYQYKYHRGLLVREPMEEVVEKRAIIDPAAEARYQAAREARRREYKRRYYQEHKEHLQTLIRAWRKRKKKERLKHGNIKH